MPNKGKDKGKRRKGTGGNLNELLLEYFKKNAQHSFSESQLIKKFASRFERSQIIETLRKMETGGKFRKSSRGNYSAEATEHAVGEELTGRVDMSKQGDAFVMIEGRDKDMIVRNRNLNQALDGDLVKVMKLNKNKSGTREEGVITEIITRKRENFVGRVQKLAKHTFVIPDNPKIHVDFFIDESKSLSAENGDKVIVKMLDWPRTSKNPFGAINEIMGKTGGNDQEMKIILIDNGFPLQFPGAVMQEADELSSTISKEEIDRRRDFRKITTFTIDPIDAKDFDDALSIQKLPNGNWEIGVHIADVSHYVKPGCEMDKEAYKRATSVYLVDRVNPMFPEILSNVVCSLRPKEEKCCFAAVFEMNEKAEVIKSWYGRTAIYSDKRFSYEEAQEVLEGQKDGPFKEELLLLNDLAKKLRKKRFKEGSINFESPEVKFKLDENSKPIGVFVKHRKDAHMLIEDFMLLANKYVAQYIGKEPKSDKKRPAVYRIHDLPDVEKLVDFRQFAKQFGYNISFENPKQIASEMNKLMKEIEGKPEEPILQDLAIRCMAKAVYSTDNIGHYGLGFEDYTHFTSPIRRYPDVMVHRLLEAVLQNKAVPEPDKLQMQCAHSSERERAAQEAERTSVKYKMCEYMKDREGQVFEGVISGVKNWGFYVEIPELNCEGLVRKESLRDDNYIFEEKKIRFVGMFNNKTYQLGNTVKIKVDKVDMVAKTLDFVLA